MRFVGQTEDMPAALQAADLVLAPSLKAESFGRAVVEAAAMERPVIASDIGAHTETIIDGETGWRVAPGDTAAWIRALDSALATPGDILAAMGRRARERAVASYSLEAMIDGTFAVYATLSSPGRSAK